MAGLASERAQSNLLALFDLGLPQLGQGGADVYRESGCPWARRRAHRKRSLPRHPCRRHRRGLQARTAIDASSVCWRTSRWLSRIRQRREASSAVVWIKKADRLTSPSETKSPLGRMGTCPDLERSRNGPPWVSILDVGQAARAGTRLRPARPRSAANGLHDFPSRDFLPPSPSQSKGRPERYTSARGGPIPSILFRPSLSKHDRRAGVSYHTWGARCP
jgi:hypothetical protein